MAMKVSIQLTIPIRIKRIANGERIIEQTGPDEHEIDVFEGDADGESRIDQLHKMLDDGVREMRRMKTKKRKRDPQISNPTVP